MSPQSIALLTVAIVAGGNIATGKKVTAKLIIGGLILAIGLAVMNEWNEKLATQFAYLILIGALLMHSVPVLTNLTKVK